MAAPQSKSAICNLALDYLLQTNEESVSNIDSPTTTTEVICKRWYDEVRRAVLRKHPWNFAKKRVVLTQAATTPAFGYSNAYNLPNDFLRVLTLQNSNTFDPYFSTDYEIEGGQILTNGDTDETLNLSYIWDFTNVGKMDALFIDLLAIELALRMAYKFTSSSTRAKELFEIRAVKLSEATSIDGQERPPKRVERSRALTARRRLGSNQRSDLRYE